MLSVGECCPYHDLSLFERQTHCPTPVPSFLWDPPRSTLGFFPPCPVTSQGVRGLIICTDPGLSPQGGCPSTVALDRIDTVRGRGRGEENRPWLQSVGPPRQVDECPGLHDLCHPSQWSQATMSYSLLVRKPSCPPPPTPTALLLPGSPRAPQSTPEPELAGLPLSINTGGLSLTAPATTSLALSTLYPDCADSYRQHTLTGPTTSWHTSPQLAFSLHPSAYVRLLQH